MARPGPAGLDLSLRDARLGYLSGYDSALASGKLSRDEAARAAAARRGERWQHKLEAVRQRNANRN